MDLWMLRAKVFEKADTITACWPSYVKESLSCWTFLRWRAFSTPRRFELATALTEDDFDRNEIEGLKDSLMYIVVIKRDDSWAVMPLLNPGIA